MKIAVLTRHAIPFGEKIRIDGIVGVLRDNGHDVDAIAMNARGAIRSPSPGLALFFAREFWRLTRTFGLPASRAILKVWLDCILAAYALIPELRAKAPRIVLAETHHAGLCAWLLRPYLNFALYMDFHGTADEVASNPPFFRQAQMLEGILVRESDFAISCSGIMRSLLISRHGGDPERHIVCHNGTTLMNRFASFGLPLRVIYAGVFAYYQRIMDYVDAARINDDPEIEFYLMGGGGNEAEVLDYIAAHKVPITWLGYKPRYATLDVFATMQVGVLPTTDDIARQVASPIKLLDYASCGLPVVTVAVGEWSSVISDYNAGVVCRKCDPESLLAAIRMLKDEIRWTNASRNAQRMVREVRSWPTVMAPLVQKLRSLEAVPAPAMAD